jgi:hypothetical protein
LRTNAKIAPQKLPEQMVQENLGLAFKGYKRKRQPGTRVRLVCGPEHHHIVGKNAQRHDRERKRQHDTARHGRQRGAVGVVQRKPNLPPDQHAGFETE